MDYCPEDDEEEEEEEEEEEKEIGVALIEPTTFVSNVQAALK